MNNLYIPFVRQGNPILFMDDAQRSLTKYVNFLPRHQDYFHE